jgi:hypothetical protein
MSFKINKWEKIRAIAETTNITTATFLMK